jgi:hypothetical protein
VEDGQASHVLLEAVRGLHAQVGRMQEDFAGLRDDVRWMSAEVQRMVWADFISTSPIQLIANAGRTGNSDAMNQPWVPDELGIEAMLATFNSAGAQPSTSPNDGHYSFPAHPLDAEAGDPLAVGAQAPHGNDFVFNPQHSAPGLEFVEGSSGGTSRKEMHEVWEEFNGPSEQ